MTININQNAIQNILIVQEHETSRTSYKLFKEIGSSSLVEDHRLFRFKIEGRDTILHGDPRFVGGNLLVMEFWEPDFTPPGPISLVWMHLWSLSIEFWSPRKSVGTTVEAAGNPIRSMIPWTNSQRLNLQESM